MPVLLAHEHGVTVRCHLAEQVGKYCCLDVVEIGVV